MDVFALASTEYASSSLENPQIIANELKKLFDGLNGFTIKDYSAWSNRESSERVWFTPVSKTEGGSIKISKYLEWAHRQGIGQTEIDELPVEVNPYARYGIHILKVNEDTNPGGSGKDRPASFMLYVYSVLGLLDEKDRITIAGAGNFAKSIATYVKKLAPQIKKIESYMGYVAIERNPDLIDELEKEGVEIIGCKDTQCPSIMSENGKPVERGKAITDAWLEEATTDTTVFLDQHGYWKPFDAALNSAAYYHTLGSEIIGQVKKLFGDVPFEYCQGMGTRGSLVGTAVRLLYNDPRIKIISQIPKASNGNENYSTFQFGLRTREQLGRAYTLDSANKLCERIYEIPDSEVAKTFLTLLENGIPVCPSSAGNITACLMRAEELYKKRREGIIATVKFDGLKHYKRFLEHTLPDFKKYSEVFENVVSLANKEGYSNENWV